MKQKLTSRKFWALLAAIIAALGTGFTGEVTWDKALAAIVVAVAAYAAAEGYTDGQRAKAPPAAAYQKIAPVYNTDGTQRGWLIVLPDGTQRVVAELP